MEKEHLIKSWLLHELTTDQQEDFENLDDYQFHKRIVDTAQYFKAEHVNEISSYEDFMAYRNKKQSQKSSNWLRPVLKIAAVFVLMLGIASVYYTNFYGATTAIADRGEKNEVYLPDDSMVVVNALSEIAYNKNSWEEAREIELKGEAFFDVNKGSTFNVVTALGKVTVLGTEFNVKQRDNYFEIQCYEGLVQVTLPDNKIYKLPAGNSLRFMDNIVTQGTVKELGPSWMMHNLSKFKSVPYFVVLQEFERQYNTTFSLHHVDKNQLFTGGFINNNIEEGIKSITLPLELSYSISEDKKHIILSKR